MARTVDPARHEARRLAIIDAALTCFSAGGYAGTTTAAICREASIGSGTFFHYFPTKQSLLLAILALGTDETRSWFDAREPDAEPYAVLEAYVERVLADYGEPRIAGFVRAVSAVLGEPEVEAALAHDTAVVQECLAPWVARAQAAGTVRDDLAPTDLAAWLMVLLDGFLGRLASDTSFTAAVHGATLRDAARRLLAP